jgi:hypothetical protein
MRGLVLCHVGADFRYFSRGNLGHLERFSPRGRWFLLLHIPSGAGT